MLSLDINLDPLWASVNLNFPIFFGILIIPASITIAINLANYIIDKVSNIFK